MAGGAGAAGPTPDVRHQPPPEGDVRVKITMMLLDGGAGFREIHIQARAGDVMTGGGGSTGPAPSFRHQTPGAERDVQ